MMWMAFMQQAPYFIAPELTMPPAMAGAVEFLKLVIPEGGYQYATSHIGAATRWRDEVHSSFYPMVQSCFALSDKGENTYFALSAFTQGWHTIQLASGREKKMFRTQGNACMQKSLWLDIDCATTHKDSPYADEAAVYTALSSFLLSTKLPLPSIVASGSGVHLYWSFQEAVPTAQWNIMAGMLKALTVHFKLAVDHSRTTDAASVLRIPGTRNYGKNFDRNDLVEWKVRANPYPVLDIVRTMSAALAQYNIPPVTSTPRAALPVAPLGSPVPPPPSNLSFATDESFQGPLRHPFRIIKECRQIQTSAFGSRSQWYNMMLVMKHCAFGEQAIHDISKMDTSRYTVETTADHYQQAIDGGAGPCRCTTFNTSTPGICPECPYWGKISTPLMLGETYQEKRAISMPSASINTSSNVSVVPMNSPTMDVVPFHTKEFSVVPGQGIIWHKKELVSGETVDPDEDVKHYITKDILISETEIYIHSLCIDNTGRNIKRSYVIRKQPQGKAAEDILFDIGTSLGQHKLVEWLANNGMLPIKPKYYKQMSDFMNTYLAAVQNRLPEIYLRETFGWVNNQDKITGEDYHSFVLGDQMYSHRGVTRVKLSDRAFKIARKLSQKGSLEEWKKIPEMYRMLNQFFPMYCMCGAFGAPFMHFGVGTAENCAHNIWEDRGGRGKTHVLRAINGVWGHPKNLLMGQDDTAAGRFQHYAVMKHIPMTIDEITNSRDWEMDRMTYSIVNGKEKIRSTSTGTDVTVEGTWETQSFFTSNNSLYSKLRGYNEQSKATLMRIIEWQWEYADYGGTPTARYVADVCSLMDEHYGHAGPKFLEFCFAHPFVFDYIPKFAKEFYLKHNQSGEERFWLYTIGTNIAAGRVAAAAGLLNYDMDWLEEQCINTLLPTIRAKVNEVRPTGLNVLADYLNESKNNILVVTGAKRPPTMADPGANSGLDQYVRNMPSGPLFARIEADTRWCYLSTRPFHKWLTMNNIAIEPVLKDLAAAGVYQPRIGKIQYSLGSCVSVLDRSRTMSYKFDLLKMDGYYETIGESDV